jgi:hypothetical protein
MADQQLELPFMTALHKKYDKPSIEDVDAIEQSSVIALFDNQFDHQDEWLFQLKKHDSWNYSHNDTIEVLVFEDTSCKKFYRAERLVNNGSEVINWINSWEVLDCIMIELPEVEYKKNDKGVLAWVYK